jgi:hypothetical protein
MRTQKKEKNLQKQNNLTTKSPAYYPPVIFETKRTPKINRGPFGKMKPNTTNDKCNLPFMA